jgi:methyltransferase (TIGR00027 family)
MKVFEVDRPGAVEWKRQRLRELGFDIPDWLKLVPVDFETEDAWWDGLIKAGFDPAKSAVVASTGVSMYLTREAIAATFRQIARLAPGSTLAMTFILPLELIDAVERPQHRRVYERARAAGTPFISFFSPAEITQLALECGFKGASHVSTEDLIQRYFAGRSDGLRPSSGEAFLIART